MVTGLCPSCAAPLHGLVGAGRGRPAQCAQGSLGSILLFMETQTWCPRAHPVQWGGIWAPGQVCHPCHLPRIYRVPGSLGPYGPKVRRLPWGIPPPLPWASGCRVGPQEEGRASGGKPPRRGECDSAKTGRRREGRHGDRPLWRLALPALTGPSPAPLEQGASGCFPGRLEVRVTDPGQVGQPVPDPKVAGTCLWALLPAAPDVRLWGPGSPRSPLGVCLKLGLLQGRVCRIFISKGVTAQVLRLCG